MDGIVELSPGQIAALQAHYELLVRWNKTVNLTTITSLEEAVERHYCESLFLGTHLPAGALRVVDVGSGAGFPGFPVAILRPECTVALVESHQRKAVFLREARAELGNIRVIGARAETLGQGSYDWVVSRAVRPSEVLALNLAPQAAVLMSGSDLDRLEQKPNSV